MTKLRVASLNMSGAQGQGEWARFVHRCRQWSRSEGVDVVLGQEHNLDPARERELRAIAARRQFHLVISFAERAADGVHRGGTLVLMNMGTVGWPELREDQAKSV